MIEKCIESHIELGKISVFDSLYTACQEFRSQYPRFIRRSNLVME
jgi:hypothetical protein